MEEWNENDETKLHQGIKVFRGRGREFFNIDLRAEYRVYAKEKEEREERRLQERLEERKQEEQRMKKQKEDEEEKRRQYDEDQKRNQYDEEEKMKDNEDLKESITETENCRRKLANFAKLFKKQ